MKKSLFLSTILLAGLSVSAQDMIAATGLTKGKIDFQDFRKIDTKNLNSSEILFSKSDKLSFTSNQTNQKNCACSNYIAAMSVSEKGDIFYIPMTQNKVMSFQTSAKKGNYTTIENSALDTKDNGTYYARMTTSSDGYMYAINNRGNELIKISENGSSKVVGSIPSLVNQIRSLGDEKLGFGGDMIADAFGNLYILSASANVFKINPNDLTSSYIGKIKGLPEGYTVNGAAVEKEGSVLIATSSDKGFYALDFDTLEAKFITNYDFPIYDLASPYFLKQNEVNEITSIANSYSLFPTIVKTNELNIVSKSNENNILNLGIWNLNNKKIYSNTITLKSIGDFKLNLNGSLQPGIYILKATNQNGVEVLNTKFTLVR